MASPLSTVAAVAVVAQRVASDWLCFVADTVLSFDTSNLSS